MHQVSSIHHCLQLVYNGSSQVNVNPFSFGTPVDLSQGSHHKTAKSLHIAGPLLYRTVNMTEHTAAYILSLCVLVSGQKRAPLHHGEAEANESRESNTEVTTHPDGKVRSSF